MPAPSIAAVLTVHNRKDLTLACLGALEAQRASTDATITAYVLDDGSTDGTADAIREQYPDVRLLLADGSFFWNGGMRVAMARARRDDPDWYLWLNDDTTLAPTAVATLLAAAEHVAGGPETPLVVCGAVEDPDDGSLPYSGVTQRRLRPMYFDQIRPGRRPRQVDTMNGNCVLLSRRVVQQVGNLDAVYRHGMGDYDYGLRARRAGAEVWLAPGVAGQCRSNPGFLASGGTVGEELARFSGVKHLPPMEWLHFTRRWAGVLWPLAFVSPYLRQLVNLLRR